MKSNEALVQAALRQRIGHLEREIATLEGLAFAAWDEYRSTNHEGSKAQAENLRDAADAYREDMEGSQALLNMFNNQEVVVYAP